MPVFYGLEDKHVIRLKCLWDFLGYTNKANERKNKMCIKCPNCGTYYKSSKNTVSLSGPISSSLVRSQNAKDCIQQNKILWNNWTLTNMKSSFYSLSEFTKQKSSLKSIEIEEMGIVKNKNLMHLQCHFGLDTLSWANKGAKTTGVDLSDKSIKQAILLSKQYNISSKFICANVLDLQKIITEKYDIVYTSYGVLEWLPDLKKWAETISFLLKPGGTFYMIEFHPFLNMLDDKGEKLIYPYFFKKSPLVVDEKGSYTEKSKDTSLTSYTWLHNLGEIVTSLISAGIKVKYLHEFPYSTYNCFPFLKKIANDKYVIKKNIEYPHMFSIKGTKA